MKSLEHISREAGRLRKSLESGKIDLNELGNFLSAVENFSPPKPGSLKEKKIDYFNFFSNEIKKRKPQSIKEKKDYYFNHFKKQFPQPPSEEK